MKKFRNLTPDQLDELVRRYDHGLPTIVSAKIRRTNDDEWQNVKVCDDSFGEWYIWGREYGPEYVVRAQGEYDARENVIDELPTIPGDEIHEAYNAFDRLLEFLKSRGHENNLQLRKFCSRWDSVYFAIDTHDANNTGAWDRWGLDESYQMQSNCTDTGIVNVGHYEWMESYPGQWQILLSGELD